jgi:hypothetical protein
MTGQGLWGAGGLSRRHAACERALVGGWLRNVSFVLGNVSFVLGNVSFVLGNVSFAQPVRRRSYAAG